MISLSVSIPGPGRETTGTGPCFEVRPVLGAQGTLERIREGRREGRSEERKEGVKEKKDGKVGGRKEMEGREGGRASQLEAVGRGGFLWPQRCLSCSRSISQGYLPESM